MNEPLNLVALHGITADQLYEEIARCSCYYRGDLIVPAEATEVQIIPLMSARIEPDIEDEP
jgi:hypothetical protein